MDRYKAMFRAAFPTLTIKEFLDYWSNEVSEHNVLIGRLKKHAIPYIGSYEINDYHGQGLREMELNMHKQGLNPNTVRVIYSYINVLLEAAYDYGASDQRIRVSPPKFHSTSSTSITVMQFRTLRRNLPPHPQGYFYEFLLLSGLQRQLCAGCLLSDFDPYNKTLRLHNKLVQGTLIPLPEAILYSLSDEEFECLIHQIQRIKDWETVHSNWKSSDAPLLFPNETGGYLRARDLDYPLLRKLTGSKDLSCKRLSQYGKQMKQKGWL